MRSALRVDDGHRAKAKADGLLPSASDPDAPHPAGPSLEHFAQEAAAGDALAFERLVRRSYARIQRWALVVTGDPDEADDVTQDTLLRMHRTISQYRGEARFTTWLYRVTQTVALDRARRAGRRDRKRRRLAGQDACDSQVLEMPDVVGRIEAKRLESRVRRFLRDLPLRQREAFDLVDLQGHTPSEAAEMLQMKAVTVRAHLFRARRAIRGRLVQEDT